MIVEILNDNISLIKKIKEDMSDNLETIVNIFNKAIEDKQNIFFMGNGGSASDSLHLAAEFVGRFRIMRRPLSAISLAADTSIITSIGNDFGFEYVFSRQIEALTKENDLVIGLSTSGNSKNIINGLRQAKKNGAVTIGFTGETGGEMKNLCDYCVMVPSKSTARIQEAHIVIGHIICEMVEQKISRENKLYV